MMCQTRMDSAPDLATISRTTINQETARIAWKELLRFFAAGTVIMVSTDLDLVDVACQMAQDNKAQVESWLAQGKMARVSDQLAREWLEADVMLWAVVVKPWILVQHSAAC